MPCEFEVRAYVRELETTNGLFHEHSEGCLHDADRPNGMRPITIIRHFQRDLGVT